MNNGVWMNYPKLSEINPMYILFTPAIVAFIIALIPTFKYHWPLSWDIYYHTHMAQLYLESGLTLWDSLTYAPFGRPIYYPPIFHYLLATIVTVFKVDVFLSSKYLQPILSFFLVLSFTYVGKKLYNWRVGVMAGFLLFFTVLFHRSMLPLPETLALILLPLALYFYFHAREEKNWKYAFIAGLIGGLISLTHSLTALMMVGVVISFTLTLKLRGEKIGQRCLGIFLGITLLLCSIWLLPLWLQHGYVFHNPQSVFQSPHDYFIIIIGTFGVPIIIFVSIWMINTIKNGFKGDYLKKMSKREILILSWFLFILILSNAYLIGISILADRILNFAVFPAVILAALGLEYLRSISIKKRTIYPKLTTYLALLIIFAAVLSALFCAVSIKPMVNDSQLDLAQWFHENGDKKRVVMSLSEGIDPVIVSVSRQPVSTGGYHPGMVKVLNREMYYTGNYTKEDLIRDNIGYLVESSPMVHPDYFKLVYQNKDYKVWRVDI